MKQPLYLALATLLQRQRNLANAHLTGNPNALAIKDHVEDELTRLCKEHLPSGSGFDNGTRLATDNCTVAGRPYPGRLWFLTSFHHMDEHGGYDGWTDHTVWVSPVFGGFDLSVSGRDRNQIKDFIGETFHQILSMEVEYQEMPA